MAARPPVNVNSSFTNLWMTIDKRIQTTIQLMLDRIGKPRARVLSVNFPLVGTTIPTLPAWVASVCVENNVKIIGWSINSFTAGSVQVDLRVSAIQPLGGTQPTYASILGSSSVGMTSSYTAQSQDTHLWTTNELSAGVFLHIFLNSATSITQTTLALRVIDMDAKVFAKA